ncbi:(2Fe-2S)-binding protein [Actinomadura sp. B10D3]|uniref:(2Fe-2S)-binding protein n=1 Tax=Actinomadura sp. B10D3 TaxID=3153557 RepID=UPI00325EA408
MGVEVGSGEVAGVLWEVARIGPYFDVSTSLVGSGWCVFPGDGVLLAELTDDYAQRLGTGEQRVAASLVFQGLAARLWSPVVAAAARGIVSDLGGLRWRWAAGEAIELGLDEPRGWRVGSVGEAAELLERVVVDGQLRPLREVMLGFVSLADGLLWGNAASALAGSLNVGPAGGRVALVRELLGRGPLAGTGEFGDCGFIRNNCCLYYRVPGGGMCGDCGLARNVR